MLVPFFIILLMSCGQQGQEKAPAGKTTEATPLSARTVIKYAHGFTIDYFDHYKLVRILDRENNRTDTLEYIFLQEGASIPAGHPTAQVIHIPVKNMVLMSSMHIGMADFVGVADKVTGLGSLQYVSSPVVRDNIRAKKVTEVGLDGNLNNELLLAMHPGLLMTMGNPDASFGKYKVLEDAGIPVLLNAEWLESTPLARAEWVKLMAALVNEEDKVNKKFDSVADAYNKLALLGSGAATKPHVIIGMPFKGSWFIPAGESYVAAFLHDAGAGYKWADSKGSGSLALNLEMVTPEALTAEYWLNVGYVDSKKDIAAKDPRYESFLSYRKGQVYNFNKKVNDIGSNDYWESGIVNPQVILADLIRILHPELLPDHELVYYKQLQ